MARRARRGRSGTSRTGVRSMAGRARELRAVAVAGLLRVAGRARLRRRRGLVRRVAAGAGGVAGWRRRCLTRVAGRAGGRGALRFVRRVAARARRVAGRHRLCLARVAARAARRRQAWLVRGGRVAARARGVARPRRPADLVVVAARAGRGYGRRRRAVRVVAVEAARGRVTRLGVAALAPDGLLAHGGALGLMDRMTARARRDAGRRRVRDGLLVTARARTRRRIVLCVAVGAAAVRGGCDHALIRVARGARAQLAVGAVRGVAGRACSVAAHDDGRGLGGVARGALVIRAELVLVHRVAVETAAHAGMVGLAIFVAIGAGARRRRGCLVRSVAIEARLIPVTIGPGMAPRAALLGRRGAGAELMAVATRRCLRRRVQRRLHRRVAALADLRRRRGEPALAVALAARDLADVLHVARARAHLEVGRGDVLGLALLESTAAERDERDDEDDRLHGRAPISWHRRQGSAVIGCRLDQPGGWMLPPTPPTRWQPTHNISPAPPWQPAHAAGSRRASRPC